MPTVTMQTATPQVSIIRDAPTGDQLLNRLKALLSIDFDAHDLRLKECIEEAIGVIENHTGLLLSPGEVTIRWASLYDWEDLPYGPVTGEATITTLSDAPITGITLSGSFPRLIGPYPLGVKLSYEAGYETDETMPANLRSAVLNLSANLFDGGERNWTKAAASSRQTSWAA